MTYEIEETNQCSKYHTFVFQKARGDDWSRRNTEIPISEHEEKHNPDGEH